MPVQALYNDGISGVRELAYSWTSDGAVLLALDSREVEIPVLTYSELRQQLKALCQWQLKHDVVIGMADKLVEVLTIYHDFDRCKENTLLLVSTPPDEYFEDDAA